MVKQWRRSTHSVSCSSARNHGNLLASVRFGVLICHQGTGWTLLTDVRRIARQNLTHPLPTPGPEYELIRGLTEPKGQRDWPLSDKMMYRSPACCLKVTTLFWCSSSQCYQFGWLQPLTDGCSNMLGKGQLSLVWRTQETSWGFLKQKVSSQFQGCFIVILLQILSDCYQTRQYTFNSTPKILPWSQLHFTGYNHHAYNCKRQSKRQDWVRLRCDFKFSRRHTTGF